MEKQKVSTSGELVIDKVRESSFGIADLACRIAGNTLHYSRSLFFLFEWKLTSTDFDLASVLSEARSETNTAISIIKNITIAVSQMEPANMSSGGRL
jgi:hypothetical protein